MFKATLPAKPIDQYKVEWWALRITSAWCYIEHCVAIYYINTPWGKYKPEYPGGVDLIDTWMISANGSMSGRVDGWHGLFKPPLDWSNDFATESEAAQEAIKQIDQYIAERNREIAELQQRRQQVKDKHLRIAQNA